MGNKINHIIARVLSGESSSDDILSLSEWLNENEHNRDEFRQLKNYWDADVAFKHSVAPTLAVEKLQHQINVKRKQANRRQLWKSVIPMIAAACLLLVASTATFFYGTEKHTVEYYTLLTADHKSDFTLDDGTVITLNKNSRLRYSDAYGKDNRNVKLEGEAYFEVAKDPEKPFQVEMNGASITVLGTHFNVKADTESDEITTTLVAGSIRFESTKQNIVMTPNQQLTFSRSTDEVSIKQVDPDTSTAWKDGLLKYKSIAFTELIQELQSSYGVDIRIEDKRLTATTVTVSGTFSQEQSIEQILKVISRSLPIRWRERDGVYHIQYLTTKE